MLDVLLVAYLVFRLLKLVRGTRAWRVVIGIGVFLLAVFLSDKLELKTLHWLLDKATLLAPVALVILFLPELRQTIEGFARVGIWSERLITGDKPINDATLEEVARAAEDLARTHTGALMVIERGNRLDDIAANGVMVRAQVTSQLLGAVFYEGNPLHDGAVVIRDGEVLAASCRLPLSESMQISSRYHMRHRAAVGMSEQADCVVVVVSEEQGSVSVAVDGRLTDVSGHDDLRAKLREIMAGHSDGPLRNGLRRAKKIRQGAGQ